MKYKLRYESCDGFEETLETDSVVDAAHFIVHWCCGSTGAFDVGTDYVVSPDGVGAVRLLNWNTMKLLDNRLDPKATTMRDAEIEEDRKGSEAAMLEERDAVYFAVTELVAALDKAGPVAIMAASLLLADDAKNFALPSYHRLQFRRLASLVKRAAK